jgi:hypothetical protein
MDKKLYEQIDEILSIKMLFTEKSIYEVLEMLSMQNGEDLHKFLSGKYEFLDDLKHLVGGLQLSDKLRKEFFTKACEEIENEINEKAIVLAGQKFSQIYEQHIADEDASNEQITEQQEDKIQQEYKLNKLEEFKMFVSSRMDSGISIN